MMTSNQDDTFVDMLEARIDILAEAQQEDWLADYVYELIDDDEEGDIFYLPELIRNIRVRVFQSLPEEQRMKTNNELSFEFTWRLIGSRNHTRVTDGEPLKILDVAKVWLYDHIRTQNTATGRAVSDPQINDTEKLALIKKVVEKSIIPVLKEEVTTDIGFTIKDIVLEAWNFDKELEYGLEAQKQSIDSLDALIEEIDQFKPQPAYDAETIYEDYSFTVGKSESGLAQEYESSIELDMWDGIKVDDVIPICILNADEHKVRKDTFLAVDKRYFKVHAPVKSSLSRYNKYGWVSDAESYTIVMYVYIGQNEADAANAPPSEFLRVVYSYKKGKRTFNKVSVTLTKATEALKVTPQLIKNRINARWSNFRLLNSDDPDKEVVNVRQKLVVHGFQLDKNILMDLISDNNSFATLLRLNEVDKSWSRKKNLKFYVFLLAQMEIHITPSIVKSETTFVKDQGVIKTLWSGDPILSINVTSREKSQVKFGIKLILSLLTKYTEEYERLYQFREAIFEQGVEKMEPILEDVRNRTVRFNRNARVIKQLHQADPYMWNGSNYTRSGGSSPELQVIPITEDEIEYWRSQGRQVIKWPVLIEGADDDLQARCLLDDTLPCLQNYYTCSTAANPAKQKHRITLIQNTGPNKTLYPLIPKCIESNSGLKSSQDFNSVTFTGITSISNKSANHVNKTLRILNPGAKRMIGGSLPDFLGFEKLETVGMPRSQSSALMCLLYAYEDMKPGDVKSKFTTPEMYEQITEYRAVAAEYAVACLQENPGKTVEQIANEIANPDIFFDMKRYYRALEELFETNIFVHIRVNTISRCLAFLAKFFLGLHVL